MLIQPQLQRLLFVYEWSDELAQHVFSHVNGADCSLLRVMTQASEKLSLSALRGEDHELQSEAASLLGFESFSAYEAFTQANPPISKAFKAGAAITHGQRGMVMAVSSTEVVFSSESGPLFFERAMVDARVFVGDQTKPRKPLASAMG